MGAHQLLKHPCVPGPLQQCSGPCSVQGHNFEVETVGFHEATACSCSACSRTLCSHLASMEGGREERVLCKQKMQSSPACSSALNTTTPAAQRRSAAKLAGTKPHTLTAVAVSIPQLHLDEILHPKWVTDTALGERVTVAMVRTVQLTC